MKCIYKFCLYFISLCGQICIFFILLPITVSELKTHFQMLISLSSRFLRKLFTTQQIYSDFKKSHSRTIKVYIIPCDINKISTFLYPCLSMLVSIFYSSISYKLIRVIKTFYSFIFCTYWHIPINPSCSVYEFCLSFDFTFHREILNINLNYLSNSL